MRPRVCPASIRGTRTTGRRPPTSTQAKQLLAAAGYPDGDGLPEIVIYYNTSEGHKAIMEAIQEQWKAIGVKATLKNMEWKQYMEFLPKDPSVMVYRMGWIADYVDAENFFDLLTTDSGNNYTRWGEPDVRRDPQERARRGHRGRSVQGLRRAGTDPVRPGACDPDLLVHQPRAREDVRAGLCTRTPCRSPTWRPSRS